MWVPWFAIAVTVAAFALIQFRRSVPLDFVFLAAILAVTLAGILTPEDAVRGFANPAVITIASLFAITAGLKVCGLLDWIGNKLLGDVTTEFGALWRLALVLVSSSAFLLNTALVAMMAPIVTKWCRSNDVSPSRLLIPVSYFVILGGVCTLIGTSTTLVVNARLQQAHQEEKLALAQLNQASDGTDERSTKSAEDILRQEEKIESLRPLGMWELGKVGVPIALVGGLVLFFLGPRLLPNQRSRVGSLGEQRREYLVEMVVDPECQLIGKSIQDAQLRNLKGLFLIEIGRKDQVISPVRPEEPIQSGDRLAFTGQLDTIVELEQIDGLRHVQETPNLKGNNSLRHLSEVVLSPSSPVVGQRVRESDFRARYNAAIIAVHRNGDLLPNKIGDIVLHAGDTLLLQTYSTFTKRFRNSRDFYLVSSFGEYTDPRAKKKRPIAATILFVMLAWLVIGNVFPQVGANLTSPAIISLVAVVCLLGTRCLRVDQARNAIDVQLFVTIACALGLGLALERSGAAAMIANLILQQVHHPLMLLLLVYLLTMLLTEMITNNAVAALMLPIGINLAILGGHNPRPFIIAICMAASLAFLTPIGYQTNLMVMGPGGYRPSDFFKVGLPVSLASAATAIFVIPIFWPF